MSNTVATSSPPVGSRPSAVTPRDLARASATRRSRGSKIKIILGAVCTVLVVLPVLLAQVLPIPDPAAQDLSRRRLPPLAEGHLFMIDSEVFRALYMMQPPELPFAILHLDEELFDGP